MTKIVDLVRTVYGWFVSACDLLKSPLLLAVRLYWGWQFMQDGWGKFTHLDKVTEFFASLNLPAPAMAALMVATVELVGGFLFTFGIASRLVSLVVCKYDDGLPERAGRQDQFLSHSFQARRFLRCEPVYVLVCGAADSGAWSGAVRRGCGAGTIVGQEKQGANKRGMIVTH